MLSSGHDSTAIAVALAEASNHGARCITFRATADNVEPQIAEETCRRLGLKHEIVEFSMADRDIERAVQPFRQVDATPSRRFEGAGLGLSLAKAFAELHGGAIEIASRLGSGTTVTVIFPSGRLDRSGEASKRQVA